MKKSILIIALIATMFTVKAQTKPVYNLNQEQANALVYVLQISRLSLTTPAKVSITEAATAVETIDQLGKILIDQNKAILKQDSIQQANKLNALKSSNTKQDSILNKTFPPKASTSKKK